MATSRDEFAEALAADIGAPALEAGEVESILALAAVAAHGTGDRTAAPLAAFLAGIAAAGSDDRRGTLDAIRRRAAQLAPEAQ